MPVNYGAKPKRRYPVVYLLHAAFGTYKSWTDSMNIAAMTEDFPAIFVMPDGGKSGFYSDWYNDGAGGPPEWERYHVRELIPLIDGTFRTIADRSHRALIGGSMGGFGAFSYAARHPDLFGAAVSISGAVDTNYFAANPIVTSGPLFEQRPPNSVFGPKTTQEVRWRGHNPVDLADNLRPMDLQVQSHNGMPGGNHQSFDTTEMFVYEMSRSLHRRLEELGIGHIWGDYGPGGHTIPYARIALRDSLAHLRDSINRLPPPPKRFSYTAIEPTFSVWGWDFSADPNRALEFIRVSNASRRGLTLTGSGTETVTTAPYFRRKQRVDVIVDGVVTQTVRAKRRRITFTVDLGPAHPDQQYTQASRAAGEGTPGYFRTRAVQFVPRRRVAG